MTQVFGDRILTRNWWRWAGQFELCGRCLRFGGTLDFKRRRPFDAKWVCHLARKRGCSAPRHGLGTYTQDRVGKLEWPPLRLPLAVLLRREGFDLLPFTWEDGEAANALPLFHKDPMDRILIASALRAGMTVITSNRIFPRYGVRTVW